jgi:ribosomal protein S18 acetylase RimI-like enzyme
MTAFSVRPAINTDIESICGFDQITQVDPQRRSFIQQTIAEQTCFVMTNAEQQVIGYIVLEYSFYEQGFVSLLIVHPAYRRQRVGDQLLLHVESICRTAKLFTSTNLSNVPMQSLLAKRKYLLSGVLHHLDEDDPELVYVKYL